MTHSPIRVTIVPPDGDHTDPLQSDYKVYLYYKDSGDFRMMRVNSHGGMQGPQMSLVLVALDRRRGKTERLLDWMAAAPVSEHRVCVSPTLEESHRVQRIGLERGLESWQFCSLSETMDRGSWSGVLAGRGGRIVLGLDNIDIMLPALLGREVGMVTITTPAV